MAKCVREEAWSRLARSAVAVGRPPGESLLAGECRLGREHRQPASVAGASEGDASYKYRRRLRHPDATSWDYRSDVCAVWPDGGGGGRRVVWWPGVSGLVLLLLLLLLKKTGHVCP